MNLFIGLMSGTSLDGVDGVLADFSAKQAQVRAHAHRAFDSALCSDLLALNRSGDDEIHRSALAANRLSREYAAVVRQLLEQARLRPSDVRAVGAHGQTVRHQPGEFDGTGYTVQLINAALLAEQCGVDVVCDFRSRDVAAGGQGAPLVPAFHAARFARSDADVAVLNLGGIANLTLIAASAARVAGFDCGPGNALLDGWCQRHLGRPFDEAGRWAASGRVHGALLQRLLAEPYFARAAPKSTGRELFNLQWLQRALDELNPAPAPEDVQATLAQLSAQAAAASLKQAGPLPAELLVCGGGARNLDLMRRLAQALPGVLVNSTASHGVPVDQVEALAFAWLAWAFTDRRPGNLPAVTGAQGPRVLGALYPAS